MKILKQRFIGCLALPSLLVFSSFTKPSEEIELPLLNIPSVTTEDKVDELPQVKEDILVPMVTPNIEVHQEEEVEEVKQPVYQISDEEYNLLLNLIYCESNSESLQGQKAVAQVVINRTYHSDKFPSSITDVVYQQNQFTPVSTGIIHNVIPNETNKEALDAVLYGEEVLPTNVLFFWSTSMDVTTPNSWFTYMHNYNYHSTLGGHYFYYG